MALYALGDLHLNFQTKDKSMDKFGDVWIDHEKKAKRNIEAAISPEDTLVLTGDHSWGRNLNECREDLEFIAALPGRKILLRGNHDMFWPANKTEKLNSLFEGRLLFLQNNYYAYKDYALVGTKGATFEGPFYIGNNGNVVWDEEMKRRSDKLVRREEKRLRTSFEKAAEDGYKKFIMFLHYPPTSIIETESVFTRIAEEYHVDQVVYSHCHGVSRFDDSIRGMNNGIFYSLVSGDYRDFKPKKILD